MSEYKCENCPMRQKAEAKPKSLMARFWRWHTTIPQNRHPFSDLKYLIQLVTDKHGSDALSLQIFDHGKQRFHLFPRQGRRWLIHDDQLHVVGQCPANGYKLLIGQGNVAHQRI